MLADRLAPSPADEQQVRAGMRRLHEAKELPKNALGKVQKSELRKLL